MNFAVGLGSMLAQPTPTHRHPVVQAFELVGSLRATIALLVFGVVSLSIGVILEFSRDAAGSGMEVNRGYWFDLFLALLALNVFSAVLNALPLKRHQLSLVLVHFALIAAISGVWSFKEYGFNGELIIKKGEGTSSLMLFEREVVMTEGVLGYGPSLDPAKVRQQFFLPHSGSLLGLPLQEQSATLAGIKIIDFRQNGSIHTEITAAPESAGPGLEFQISGRGETIDSWLIADHPTHRTVDLGLIEVGILNFRSAERFALRAASVAASTGVTIESIGSSNRLHIPLPESLGKEIDAGNGISVIVRAFIERARVADGRLLDVSDAPSNPAVELEIRGGVFTERHIVFSRFPDFGIHELTDAPPMSGAIRLESAGTSAKTSITVLCSPAGHLFTQVSNNSGRLAAVPLPSSHQAEISGTPYVFSLKHYLAHASFTTEALATPTEEEKGASLVKLRVTKGNLQSEFWLQLGNSMQVPLLGRGYSLAFRRQSRKMPFRIGLESIEISHFPGTLRPADYTSHVLVAATDGSVTSRSAVVSADQPLDYLGYRLLQSNFEVDEDGEPNATVLSASYNPGVAFYYASFLFLILGLGWYALGDGPVGRGKKKSGPSSASSGRIEMVLNPEEPNAGSESSEPPDDDNPPAQAAVGSQPSLQPQHH